jgi:hypothetical protein
MVVSCRSGGRGVGHVTAAAVVSCYGGCVVWRSWSHGLTVVVAVVSYCGVWHGGGGSHGTAVAAVVSCRDGCVAWP